VLICFIQAMMVLKVMGAYTYAGMRVQAMIMGIVGMTAGTVFLMWLGEQIDEYGIGNGISLIIMAGIISRMPWAIGMLMENVDLRIAAPVGTIGPAQLLFLVAAFVFVVARRDTDNTKVNARYLFNRQSRCGDAECMADRDIICRCVSIMAV